METGPLDKDPVPFDDLYHQETVHGLMSPWSGARPAEKAAIVG